MESFKDLGLSKNNGEDIIYNYVNVFKNRNNLPIHRIHLERSWYELRKDLPKDFDFFQLSDKEFEKTFYEKKTEIIPALDKRWLPKCLLFKYEPYEFTLPKEENVPFVTNNMQFLESLEYLLKCNYHQFWCTILFEPSAVLALRSFILNPIPWFQSAYLEDEYADIYKTVFNKFLQVYEKLLTFNYSQSEYMPEEYGFKQLIDKKLINLPIVITLAYLYKDTNLDFVNKLTNLYFNDTSQLDFQIKEVEEMINHTLIVSKEEYLKLYLLLKKLEKLDIKDEALCKFNSCISDVLETKHGVPQGTVIGPILFLPYVNDIVECVRKCKINIRCNTRSEYTAEHLKSIVLEMIGGHVCGFDKDAVIVPISVSKRPPVFSLPWVYSVVNYLLNTLALLNTLLQFYKPSIEICLNKELPHRMPFTYVHVYRELYEMLDDREELKLQQKLSERVFDEINLGRTEFIDVYHVFISNCLDKTLENMGDDKQQEQVVETYLNLLTTALEDDYFICDYNMKYNVAAQNEMFESCFPLDTTRTKFIESCINKFPRQKRLQQLSKLKKQTIEDVFKRFKPPEIENEEVVEPEPSSSRDLAGPGDDDIEKMIKDIIDMFPHLGDGFVLQCLEAYNYNSADVINAILEENLPPHLYDIPFDSIRIPPEPEPEKPVLAYRGKKPEYDDALKLLNDKQDLTKLKTFVLEGVQYSNDYLYDDEYDDRYDDDVPIKVADNPLEEEILTFNPNHEELASDTSYSSNDEYDDYGKPVGKTDINATSNGKQNERSRMNFCEDPALIRERREAKYRSRQPQTSQKKPDVVGKAKGQGQEKNVLKARDNKNVHKSSRANHNRKGGAQWKRNKGMIPS